MEKRTKTALTMTAYEWLKYAKRVCLHRKHLLTGATNELADLRNEMLWQIFGKPIVE